jgi:VanZ family protein
MLILLAVFAFLLLAGSLFPWQFADGPSLAEAASHVFHSWRAAVHRAGRADVLVNLIIYIPIGFTGYLWEGWRSRAARILLPILAGGSLSFLVETLQRYVPHRSPSFVDLLCNTISAALGVALAAVLHSVMESRHIHWKRHYSIHPSSALLLLAVWVSALGWPMRARPLGIITRVRALMSPQPWEALDFVAGALPWLLAGCFLSAVAGPRVARWQLPALLPFVFLLRLISPGHDFTWSHAGGALSATLLYCLLPERRRHTPIWLAWVWLAWIVLAGLSPFNPVARAHAFSWIPFKDMVSSPWLHSIGVLLTKTWAYGAIFWLFAHTRLNHPTSLVITMVSLISVEIAQRWLPGRTPGLTDPAIGLLAAALLWLVDRRFENKT